MLRSAMRSRWALAGLGLAIGLVAGVGLARVGYPTAEVLLTTSETIIGQPIVYPTGQAEVTAAIVTLTPGQETGWHRHDAPLFAYMLAGELTVDYGPDGTRTYRAGDAFVEAFRSAHDGHNPGTEDAKVLSVFIGAEGVANTVPLPRFEPSARSRF